MSYPDSESASARLSPGMMGVIPTVMDTSDVDPFCQTLLDGIRSLKGRS